MDNNGGVLGVELRWGEKAENYLNNNKIKINLKYSHKYCGRDTYIIYTHTCVCTLAFIQTA